MSTYTVITADIMDSRKSNLFTIEELNKRLAKFKYPEEMVTSFKILRGDEIQGVFKGILAKPQILRRLRYCIYPLQLRIGIGIGDIIEGLDKDTSWQMNGPAFHLARNALDQIKADNNFIVTRLNSFLISNQGLDLALNTILFLIDTIQRDWTESQWQAVHIYEEEATYKKAAKRLGIASLSKCRKKV